MDDAASSPPEQAETEQGFGSGLRAQLARSQEAREHAHQQDEEAASLPGEAASPAQPEADGLDVAERGLSESLARGEELRRSLSARHAKLAEWVASQGRELRSPEAAALLASGTAETELERRREEAARLERLAAELTEREAELAEREQEAQARADEAVRESAEAARTRQSALEREAELDVRAQRLHAREAELEERVSLLDHQDRELRDRGDGLDGAARLTDERAELDARADGLRARERTLDEREAELEEREQRLGRREDALGELKDWLVRKERELAAYLGDAVEPAG